MRIIIEKINWINHSKLSRQVFLNPAFFPLVWSCEKRLDLKKKPLLIITPLLFLLIVRTTKKELVP